MGGRGVDDEAWLTLELVQGRSDFSGLQNGERTGPRVIWRE